MKCENPKCESNAPRLFAGDDGFVCAPCCPDSIWRQYPNWKENKDRHLREFYTYQAKVSDMEMTVDA